MKKALVLFGGLLVLAALPGDDVDAAVALSWGPISLGPVSLGPVSLGPVSLGPVSLGPVSLGPVSLEAARDAAATPQPAPTPCPPEMALAGAVCIDRWEAHVVGSDGSAHPHNQPLDASVGYRAVSAAGVKPQGYISRVQAAAACRTAGKRLCSLDEWRRACGGPRAWHHPYGNDEKRGRCNNRKEHLLAKLFGRRAWDLERHLNAPALNDEPGFLAATGAHPDCATVEGVHDMVGNLHEWVSDKVDGPLLKRYWTEGVYRRDQPHMRNNGVFVGGFYSTAKELGPGCMYITIAHRPRYHDYSTGFRCCRVPRDGDTVLEEHLNELP